MKKPVSRRTVLHWSGVGLLGTAGCLAGGDTQQSKQGSPESTTRSESAVHTTSATTRTAAPETTETTKTSYTMETTTEQTPTTTTSPCNNGRRLSFNFPENYQLEYRYGYGFELTAEPTSVIHGGDLTIRLQNTTSEIKQTRPQVAYAIERRSGNEWHSILSIPDGYAWSDEAISHRPGEGFTWRFPVSREGFSQKPFQVCSPLQVGEYHFTYWGFTGSKRGLTIGFELR